MNLIITGHSVSHYRQRVLGEATARLGIRTIVVGPERWGDETYTSYEKKNFIFRTQQITGPPSFYNFTFSTLNRVISGFRPAMIYVMEEPFTLFARECLRYAKEYGCPLAIFTWENRLDFRLSEPYDRIEQDVIRDADKIICGNKLAMRRMLSVGADKNKLHVLLQSGIDTELFRPIEGIEKKYDVLYHGRLVREKGLPYLENVCRDLKLSLLTVGGRGTYHIKYGDAVDWIPYEDLPKRINQAKTGVQVPFSFQGYQEQGNFAIAECMACGIPVVISNNGSLPDNFGTAPVLTIQEGEEEPLKSSLMELLRHAGCEEERKKLGTDCRRWVIENLSVDIIAKKLVDILEVS